MPWGRLDDNLYDHPKIDRLGRLRLPALGLHLLALSWCNHWLTDGLVPFDRVAKLGGTDALAASLVAAEFWERADDGFRVHDFLEYNDSREAVMATREAARDRMRKRRNGTGHTGRRSRDVQPNVIGSSGDVQAPRAGDSESPSRPVRIQRENVESSDRVITAGLSRETSGNGVVTRARGDR
jgi:hypothetical protein